MAGKRLRLKLLCYLWSRCFDWK